MAGKEEAFGLLYQNFLFKYNLFLRVYSTVNKSSMEQNNIHLPLLTQYFTF